MVLTLFPTGCVGIYDNSARFFNVPKVGTSEVELLKDFGAPSFTTSAGSRKVHVYKVRDVKYIILVGIYEGYDLVVVVQNGRVEETKKVPRASAFTLFTPVPWAVAD